MCLNSFKGTLGFRLSPVRSAGVLTITAALAVAGFMIAPRTASAQATALIWSYDLSSLGLGIEENESAAALTDILAAQGITATTSLDMSGADPGNLSDYACVFDLQVRVALDPAKQARLDQYLRGGGGAYIVGEHGAFAFRNNSIIALLTSMGSGPVAADTFIPSGVDPLDIIEPMNPDHPLASECNSVGELDFDGIANGHWLSVGNGTWVSGTAPDYACVASWSDGQLTGAPGGIVVSSLDVNMFATGDRGTMDFRVTDRTIPTQNRAFAENLVQYICRTGAACLCEPRNHGYWHRYCLGVNAIDPGRHGHGNGPGETHDTPDLPATLLAKVNAVMAAYGIEGCAALDDGPFSDPRQAALREYATLQLNLFAGYLGRSCPIELRPVDDRSGLTVGDAVTLMQALIAGGTDAELKDARWIGEHVNNGEALE